LDDKICYWRFRSEMVGEHALAFGPVARLAEEDGLNRERGGWFVALEY
jgi:hypothetical protein